MPAARFWVSGVVQGVFFRANTREQAIRLGLQGYAKNLPDGRVEVLASGKAAALDALHAWLEQGPSVAEVTSLDRQNLTEQPSDLHGFSIL